MQIVSTLAAMKWFEECFFLVHKRAKVKIITTLKREEWINGKKQWNEKAGWDLLGQLSKSEELSTLPILILCDNKQAAERELQDVEIDRPMDLTIKDDPNQIYDFVR